MVDEIDMTVTTTDELNQLEAPEQLLDITIGNSNKIKECIQWAITKPPEITQKPGITMKKQRINAQEKEKKWGNIMIGQNDNGQWTTKLGEGMVRDVLEVRGENPIKITPKGGFEPDWETDNYIYEVKTRNWNVGGTAGEKVLGTWIKYQSIPELYCKPLRIVCVGFQEHELTYGKTKYFGDNITTKTKQILELAKSWGIEYIPFSKLIKNINYR